MNSDKTLRLILGDQLNASHSWFRNKDDAVTYVIAELLQETKYVKHHVQKVCGFFAAMAQFANALSSAGHKVIHLTLDDTAHCDSLDSLIDELLEQGQFTRFEYQLPDEYRLRQQMHDFAMTAQVAVSCCDTEHFYLADSELVDYFKPDTGHRLENFYRKMRVKFDVLMFNGEPEGGQWNFDKDNRNKFKAQDIAQIPAPLAFDNDVSAIVERLTRHQVATIGKVENKLAWPVNRQQARGLLKHFCQQCLHNFGRFQDAMTGQLTGFVEDKGWSLYHSRLSFSLNCKIISPQAVVNQVVEYYRANKDSVDIAQVEGFVRQVLGWREFVRGIYWANMPNYQSMNKLDAQRDLPSWFWTGQTKMKCMSHAISQSLDFAYAHHIQRLMVTGNFCLLAGIAPDLVDNWYLGIYIDAIEWVEMPNTRGMSQFADGGILGSKPYSASGNYINKMSDYCKDCHYQVKESVGAKGCPFNALYWRFMDRHQSAFSNNPRNAMVYKNWQKKPAEARRQVLERAEHLLLHIERI